MVVVTVLLLSWFVHFLGFCVQGILQCGGLVRVGIWPILAVATTVCIEFAALVATIMVVEEVTFVLHEWQASLRTIVIPLICAVVEGALVIIPVVPIITHPCVVLAIVIIVMCLQVSVVLVVMIIIMVFVSTILITITIVSVMNQMIRMGVVAVVVVLVIVFVSGREFIVAMAFWLMGGGSGVLPVMSVHKFIHQDGCVLDVCLPNMIHCFNLPDPHVQANDRIDPCSFIGSKSVEFVD